MARKAKTDIWMLAFIGDRLAGRMTSAYVWFALHQFKRLTQRHLGAVSTTLAAPSKTLVVAAAVRGWLPRGVATMLISLLRLKHA